MGRRVYPQRSPAQYVTRLTLQCEPSKCRAIAAIGTRNEAELVYSFLTRKKIVGDLPPIVSENDIFLKRYFTPTAVLTTFASLLHLTSEENIALGKTSKPNSSTT